MTDHHHSGHDHDHHHNDHVERGPRRRGPGAEQRLRHGPHPLRGGDPMGRFAGARGRRSKRGDVRAAVLLLLDEQPRNGYQLIQELEQRSQGAWRPSPGSVYPILSQLEDEGLIVANAADSGRTFSLTATGKSALEESRERFGQPWDAAAQQVGEPRSQLMRNVRQLLLAARQVMEAGSDDQVQRVTDIVKDARRRVYGILAEEESEN